MSSGKNTGRKKKKTKTKEIKKIRKQQKW